MIESKTISGTSLRSLIYRQSMILLELSRMSDRLSESIISIKDFEKQFIQTESLGRSALNWVLKLDTVFGESDYETHIKGKIDTYLFLSSLLIQPPLTSSLIIVEELKKIRNDNKNKEGLLFAIEALKLSIKLEKECKRTKEEENSKLILQTTCIDINKLINEIKQQQYKETKETKERKELEIENEINYFNKYCKLIIKNEIEVNLNE